MRRGRPAGYTLGMIEPLEDGRQESATPPYRGPDQPGTYRIRLCGELRPAWADWFGGLELTTDEDDNGAVVTTLTGELIDQAALQGILSQIRDLGLVLLLIERVEPGKPHAPSGSEGSVPR